MLTEAYDLQDNAISELCEMLSSKNDIYFKAPTGSGKTHMMADFMNRMISENQDIVFIVSSLSKGELARQNYSNFIQYSENEFTKIDAYLINTETSSEERLDIEENHNVYVLPRDLYKAKGKLKEGGVFISFLENLKKKGKSFYLIKDECHIATNNLDELQDYFEKTLNFSATPNLTREQYPDVQISDSDAVDARLIKKIKYMEYADKDNQETSLDSAISFFKEEKQRCLLKGVSPCMIIQISNKEKADAEWKMIKRILDQKHPDLKWMLIVNKNGSEDAISSDTNDEIKTKNVPVIEWKNLAKKNSSTIDIVIFKMIISEGWDIPRASMLYQMRDTQSSQLTEQVIGRVRRNPLLMQYTRENMSELDFLMTAYVWGVSEEKKKDVEVFHHKTIPQISDEFCVKTTVIKDSKEISQNIETIVDKVMDGYTRESAENSIFALYKKYKKINNDVKAGCLKYINTKSKNGSDVYQNWLDISNNVDNISKNIVIYRGNYSENMKLGDEVHLQTRTSYEETGLYLVELENWLWRKNVIEDDFFSFDSQAEKEWAKILQKQAIRFAKMLTNDKEDDIYLWGKNYLNKSQLRFEYYLQGIHSSYPDFIMKDRNGMYHLFEVKSKNKSSIINMDEKKYEEKIKALRQSYSYSSKLTGYHFWIPIMIGADWFIYHYENGDESEMSILEFKTYFKNNGKSSM